MPGSRILFDTMTEWFNVCVEALADTPDGAPDCRYISEGPPAWDVCPCLIVYAGGPDVGQTFPLQPALAPMHRVQVQGMVDLIPITATILRCAPQLDDSGKPPEPSAHATAALQTSSDLWAIWNWTADRKRTEQLFAPRTREFMFDPAVAVNPAGGCAGYQITIRTQIDGYRPGE